MYIKSIQCNFNKRKICEFDDEREKNYNKTLRVCRKNIGAMKL